MNSNSFNIYDASAGSGKTFTLVKEYLKILFTSTQKEAYKYILAITFTNKAVGEMKERIIDTLKTFADKQILETPNDMFNSICDELSLKPNIVQQKSSVVLNSIAHNYAAFDISTIDKFTQKLIRAFAYDLNLPLNFEVELDTETLLHKAVDKLIAKAGHDKELTNILIAFAFEKADEDKSWDVSLDFYKIAQLLVSENDIEPLNKLNNKSLKDFNVLKSELKKQINANEEAIVKQADTILTLISECGLEYNDFSNSYLPKHFEKLRSKNFSINFETKWQQDIESRTLYPKRVTPDIASTIENIQPQIAATYNTTKQGVFQHKMLSNFYKNTTPLSVLNLIQKELESIKTEQNLLLISEFNSIISNQIKDQPSPFIYERIGEKFKHYFIDEFQDTSVMQWQNLIPLLENPLSSDKGSVMIVGDAKQAIYRWRGGKAEQFIDLCNDTNPFFVHKEKTHLPTNYRSYKEVVDFNNSFFKHLSSFMFSKAEYEGLYSKSPQNISTKQQGHVSLNFLGIDKDDDRDFTYNEAVLETINNCLGNGFELMDICVLVRKKKDGVSIANHLSNNNIDIVSSETLLLDRSPKVKFITALLTYILDSKNDISKIEVLNYLATFKLNITNKHSFFSQFISFDIREFFESLKGYNICFDYKKSLKIPIYEVVELIINNFKLVDSSDAYIQFYLDFVLDYSLKNPSDLSQFLDFYNSKKDKLSIVSPTGKNAVEIMTIHKSKGLEFPVVIFPYADLDIYREKNPQEWLPINPDQYHGFSQALLNYNKDFKNYSEEGEHIFIVHQAELELDNINLLYVALTRAIEQLHIISQKQLGKTGNENLKLYSGMFINYLKQINLWDDNQNFYTFGQSQKTSEKKKHSLNTVEQHSFISTPKENHNINILTSSGLLWDTKQQEAIEKGNLLHDIMSQIYSKTDIDITLNTFLNNGTINEQQGQELKAIVLNIVNHPQLSSYFSENETVFNEKDIITKNGISLRPDRLVINSNNEVVIIDYKTGLPNNKHSLQLEHYSNALEEMNFSIAKKILIYLNDTLEIKEV